MDILDEADKTFPLVVLQHKAVDLVETVDLMFGKNMQAYGPPFLLYITVTHHP